MAEYINKAELMKLIKANDYILVDCYNSRDKGMFTVGIHQALNELPTTDIVHCGECVHRREYEEYNRNHNSFDLCFHCEIDGKYHDDDHFCADGEEIKENQSVVHCNNCKHLDRTICQTSFPEQYRCKLGNGTHRLDYFCKDGEEKKYVR